MRLPEANYTRGVKSLGRESDAAVGALLAASDYHVTRATAQQQVIEAAQGSVRAYSDWQDARDLTAAEKALSEYRQRVADIEVSLDTTPAFRTQDIPEGIRVRREESVNGEQRERTMIPTWEVRAALFDAEEAKARQDLMAAPAGKHRDTLVMRATEYGNEAGRRQAAAAYKGEFEFMVGQRNELIGKAVQAGDIAMADELIATGVATGLYSVDQARQLTDKANTDHELLTYSKAIAAAATPEQLEELSLQIPATAKWLNPTQAFNLSQQAETKALQLEEKRTAAWERAQTEQSAQARADATLAIVSSGRPMDWQQLGALNLKPADQIALVAINKAAGESRSQQSDPGTLAEIQSSIFDLSTPSPAPIHSRRMQLQNRITQELEAGRITPTDANTLYGRVQSVEGDLFTNEGYKTAVDLGYASIVGGSKDSVSFFGGDAGAKGRAIEFELELREAAQKGADPMQWMQENVQRFQSAATPTQQTWVVRDSKGGIDKTQTRAKIASDYREERISRETAEQRERQLETIR